MSGKRAQGKGWGVVAGEAGRISRCVEGRVGTFGTGPIR